MSITVPVTSVAPPLLLDVELAEPELEVEPALDVELAPEVDSLPPVELELADVEVALPPRPPLDELLADALPLEDATGEPELFVDPAPELAMSTVLEQPHA